MQLDTHTHSFYFMKWKLSLSHLLQVCTLLGWAPWNLSCLEFKFDDTRLSYWHKNKIGRIEIYFCCFLTLLILCPFGCLSKTEPTGQKISKVRKQQKNFQFCQSYSNVNRKVWYHQIWIPNNLGFIVSDLMYIFNHI